MPINSITGGAEVQLALRNTSESPVVLSVPVNYHDFEEANLAPGESLVYGAFVKRNDNMGLRDVVPLSAPPPIERPSLRLSIEEDDVILSWDGEEHLEYQVEWTVDLVNWTNLTLEYTPGQQGEMNVVDDAALSGGNVKLYRLKVRNR